MSASLQTAYTIPEAQRRHLRKWLLQWQMELDFRTDDVAEPAVDAELSIAETHVSWQHSPSGLWDAIAEEPPVESGQIRLLAPSVLSEAVRPIYVAVLSDWEPGLVLLAPYSEFTAPATRGELLTERDGLSLRVLCLWNARSVPEFLASRSWLVDELTEAESAEAWSVLRHVMTGAALAKGLADRVGAPILVEEDPRIQYQDEETALLAPLTAATIQSVLEQTVGQEEAPNELLFIQFPVPVLAIAAASPDRGRSLATREYVADALGIRIAVSECEIPTDLAVEVLADPQSQLENAEFLGADGQPLGTIAAGVATLKRPADGKLQLRLSNGVYVQLKQEG